MPYDGITTRCATEELNTLILGAKVDKIYMHQKDEVILNLRTQNSSYKLLLSANPSLARVLLTTVSRENPKTPPNFCMLLRKHLTSGRITYIRQPQLERIIIFGIESRNELGDLTTKELIIEIMGRYSNIILTHPSGNVADCAKHIDGDISSLRIMLPGVKYTLPPPQNKENSCGDEDAVADLLYRHIGRPADKALLDTFSGLSPLICREIVFRASTFTDTILSEANLRRVANCAADVFAKIENGSFSPCILTDEKGVPFDFSCIDIVQYEGAYSQSHPELLCIALDDFYYQKEHNQRLMQRSSDISKMVSTLLQRYRKKAQIQEEALSGAEDLERIRQMGDLITANIYLLQKGDKIARVQNYFDPQNSLVDITLDPFLSPSENAQKYYHKYNKLKKTVVAAKEQLLLSRADIDYLESVQSSIERADSDSEISEIRNELMLGGFMKMKSNGKNKIRVPSSPMRYLSSDGFEILVGKNNLQNDYLTLKLASNHDIWFHTKAIHGSHTVILTNKKTVPNSTLTEAAMIAAYHSKARSSYNVPVDYTEIRNVSKPSGAKPGMVIYVNYKTAYVSPVEEQIQLLKAIK